MDASQQLHRGAGQLADGSSALATGWRPLAGALRTLDALHVAVASGLPGVTFVTADRAQRSAAQQLGLNTVGIALD